MRTPKLSREQLERLIQNPHYRLSAKQQALLEQYRNAEAASDNKSEKKSVSQDVTEVHTQEVRPSDTNVVVPRVKKAKRDDDERRN